MKTPFNHVRPVDLEDQHAQAKAAALAASFHVVEVMLWEVWQALSSGPAVVSLSYDQEGDVNHVPLMSCATVDGGDVEEVTQERLDAMEQRWNDDNTPALVAFLIANESRVFHRQDFHKDILAACQAVGKSFDCATKDVDRWGRSFVAHWRQEVLTQQLPASKTKPATPRM